MQGSVRTILIISYLFSVTDTAIHRRVFCYRFAGSFFGYRYVRMALRTGGIGVYRIIIGLLVDVQADGLTVAGHRQVLTAVAGQTIFVGQTVRIENAADFVWSVAVHTDRNFARILLPQTAFDHLAVHMFDLTVAFCTGCHNVVRMDARSRVGMRPDVMRRVTGGANSRDGESLFK